MSVSASGVGHVLMDAVACPCEGAAKRFARATGRARSEQPKVWRKTEDGEQRVESSRRARGENGAHSRIRTADPLLTMEVLCRLS